MATHRIAVGELPTHSHEATTNTTGNHSHIFYGSGGSESGSGRGFDAESNNIWSTNRGLNTNSTGEHNHTITINNTGYSQAHNNIQPYIAIYIWKRVN